MSIYTGGLTLPDPVQTQAPVPGADPYVIGYAPTAPEIYVDQSVGGETGNAEGLGYSTGFNVWQSNAFTGGVVAPPVTSVMGYNGPVGQDNSRSMLQVGVAQQTEQLPDLETIYNSIAGIS